MTLREIFWAYQGKINHLVMIFEALSGKGAPQNEIKKRPLTAKVAFARLGI